MMSHNNSNDQFQSVDYDAQINELAQKVEDIPSDTKSLNVKQQLHSKIEKLQSSKLCLSADRRQKSIKQLQLEINSTQFRTYAQKKQKEIKTNSKKRLRRTSELEEENRV